MFLVRPATPRPPYTTLFRSRGKLGGVESRGEGRARGLKTRHVLVVPRCAIPRTFLEAAALAVLTPVCPLRSRSGKSERTFNGLRSEEHTSELQSRENIVCSL